MSAITISDRILDYLEKHGSITAAEAYEHTGTMRLAAYIAVLKAENRKIKMVIETGINRWGDPMHYARYYLEDRDGREKNVCEDNH